MLRDLEAHARERVDAWGGRLIEVNGEPDHVHLLFTLLPKHVLADLVDALKIGASRGLRADHEEQVLDVYSKPIFWRLLLCPVMWLSG